MDLSAPIRAVSARPPALAPMIQSSGDQLMFSPSLFLRRSLVTLGLFVLMLMITLQLALVEQGQSISMNPLDAKSHTSAILQVAVNWNQ